MNVNQTRTAPEPNVQGAKEEGYEGNSHVHPWIRSIINSIKLDCQSSPVRGKE